MPCPPIVRGRATNIFQIPYAKLKDGPRFSKTEDVHRIWHLIFDVRVVAPKALWNLFACPEYARFTIARSIYSRSFALESSFIEERMDFFLPIESRDLGHSTRFDTEELDDALMPTRDVLLKYIPYIRTVGLHASGIRALAHLVR